jgi:hypothetical protein
MSTVQTWLFPSSAPYIYGFTTSPYVKMSQIGIVALSDHALGVTKVSSGTEHPVVNGTNTKSKAWEATYPQGSCNPSSGAVLGGFGFYMQGAWTHCSSFCLPKYCTQGPPTFASLLDSATHVMTSYSVMFENEFNFQKGGKLLHVLVLISLAK